LHVFSHWNWAGKEGQNIPVWVYSNCDEVELFLNEKTLGLQWILHRVGANHALGGRDYPKGRV
jgi:hypothetical protein